MKYFIDLEFLEGKQDKRLFGIKVGETKPTIDLISIGVVCEDGREYYAISKDFNLKEAWNRYDIKRERVSGDARNYLGDYVDKKVYWIRDNVLQVIFNDMCSLEFDRTGITHYQFEYSDFKELLEIHGKSNKQIAEEILEFVYNFAVTGYPKENTDKIVPKDIEFYGYYSDYDWVVFCWLFGYMKDLPKGFPMYCIDLKQELDRVVSNKDLSVPDGLGNLVKIPNTNNKLDIVKRLSNYPKQTIEHSALHDARFNRDLYNFLKTLYYESTTN